MSDTVLAFADAEVTETDPLRRQVNIGLMVAWINADLLNRCGNDVRSSIVLYDDAGVFEWVFTPREIDAECWAQLWAAGVRSWSRGIV